MFQISMGVSRETLLSLSVPEMVDMIDYYQEAKRGG